ncbi:glycosyltransferase family 4 protein [Pedosphaera parvula]|nr:glycosyltransferase family 4 protein [Pedosphaera parvula]
MPKENFVVATPGRSVCDDNARALEHHGLLRFLALATRNGSKGIPPERTRLKPAVGLAAYAAARMLSTFAAESFRMRLHPWFDHWVKKQLEPGNHIISSYGYVNASFQWVRKHGGKTLLDGGNSHPENFWTILSEEHKRWNCPYPPVARHHYERSMAMMEHVDYVLSPSSFVSRSFLERGFKPEQMIRNIYPLDLSCFKPPTEGRPKDRPLTIISTGALSLRKGAPYMLEAFKIVHQKHPSARFRLTNVVQNSAAPILEKYRDLPIDWAPSLPHPQLAQRLQNSDIFVLASLEEGLARTALEAMACGVPVILTPNTGANDFVEAGKIGEVVPIRDPQAIADAILKWGDLIMTRSTPPTRMFDPNLISFESFEADFISQLADRGVLNSPA